MSPIHSSLGQKHWWKLQKYTYLGPKNILLKPKLYFFNNILLFGNFAATPLDLLKVISTEDFKSRIVLHNQEAETVDTDIKTLNGWIRKNCERSSHKAEPVNQGVLASRDGSRTAKIESLLSSELNSWLNFDLFRLLTDFCSSKGKKVTIYF